MSRAVFDDRYTRLERQVISRLAAIEQEDRDTCSRCSGEDCICCEIYHDRQKWKEPDQLFSYDSLDRDLLPGWGRDEDEEEYYDDEYQDDEAFREDSL